VQENANNVVLVIVLSDSPSDAQIDSIIQIFSSLTGLPASAFSIVILPARVDTSVQVEVNDASAGTASNTIVSTLEQNSTYLSSQDASLPEAKSVVVTSTTTADQGVNVVAIVVPIVVVVALIGAGILVFFLVRNKRSHRQEIELAARANPGYGAPM
jgi:hypothetical protein